MKKTLIASLLSLGFVLSAQAKDIVDTAVAAGSFKTLATALTAAGLVDTLKGNGPFTVFAPKDEAFAKIPKADVKAGQVKTVQGSALTVTTAGGVKVNNAQVVKTDIVANNGVIHVIDTVVIPK